MRVCATKYLFHYLFNPNEDVAASILKNGLRPLSDFPESERWQQIEATMPRFFEQLYHQFAAPIIQKPYLNSGVFVSPIDFRLLPDSYLYDKPRFKIPLSRIDPAYACLMYEYEGERVLLPVTAETMQTVAKLWTAELVTEWFAKDKTKLFFYVPQLMTYQPGGIPVEPADYEAPG